MIIVATPADSSKAGGSIHFDRWIPITNFEMNAADTLIARAVHEVIEQSGADASPLARRRNSEQQKFGLVCDCA